MLLRDLGRQQVADDLLGRVLATNIIDADTGEVVANANDELTEELLGRLREANVSGIQTLYTNDLDQGAYISQTLRTDDTTDQTAARIAIYRMMRPGEPPTEDSVEALRLGAVDCFPKPKVAVPAELDVIIAKLGKRIKAAKGAELKGNKPIVRAASIDWNGRLLAVVPMRRAPRPCSRCSARCRRIARRWSSSSTWAPD